MRPFELLLAADINLLKIITFIVVIAIYAINHLLSGIKKPPGQPPGVPPRPRPADATRPPADPGNADLNVELSEFLQRAAAKRQAAGGRPSAPAPARPEPSRPRKRKKQEPAAAPLRPVDEPLSQRHMVPAVDTRVMEARFENLNTLSGDRLGEHVQEAFDRPLGQLSSIGQEPAAKPVPPPSLELQPTIANEMASLLRDPQSLRGAIILNEILTPPSHRW